MFISLAKAEHEHVFPHLQIIFSFSVNQNPHVNLSHLCDLDLIKVPFFFSWELSYLSEFNCLLCLLGEYAWV